MTVTATHRQRLDAIRERSRTARERRNRARQALDASQKADDRDAIAVATMALDEATGELELSEQLHSKMLGQIAGVDGHGLGESVFDDPAMIEQLERLGNSAMPVGNVMLGPVMSREELVSVINGGRWGQPKSAEWAGGGGVTVPDSLRSVTAPAGFEIIPQPRRRLSLLDIIPASPMEGRSFGYAQEMGGFDDAREITEAEVKPETGFGLGPAELVAKTIAVWTKVLRQQLSDVPALQQIINDRLMYACLRRLESQIVAGTGEGEDLLGILNTPGIGSVEFAAGPISDLALDGIVAVEGADAVPDAVVVNPLDLASMLKATAADSGLRLDGPGAFASRADALWGLPAVTSRLLPQGQAIVGAFATACRLFIREAPNVRLSDSDQDDFIRNMVTCLAELRAGVAIWQPSGFALVHFTAGGSAATAARSRQRRADPEAS
jgi:HK97 family phage major capsid protein